jgi:uncharacterized cupredoxin-like copper-binding protein
MTSFRIASLGAVVVAAAAAWALPATAAHHTRALGIGSVTVTAGQPSEFKFTLSAKSVKNGVVTFKITNKGKLAHDFSISGRTSKMLSPGKSDTLRVTLRKGNLAYKCTVPGHAAAGMKGVLKVT